MEERSPYAAPTSTALPASADYRTARHGHLSGGDDDWTIRSILIEAWHLTRGYKGIFWLAILVYVAALLAVVSVEQWVRKDPSLGPLVAALLLVLGMLTLGVGVIWVVPMLSIAYGLVYVKLFGVYRHG